MSSDLAANVLTGVYTMHIIHCGMFIFTIHKQSHMVLVIYTVSLVHKMFGHEAVCTYEPPQS